MSLKTFERLSGHGFPILIGKNEADPELDFHAGEI